MTMPLIGLDFETYGATDLPKRGLHNYASCSTFQPLIAGLSKYSCFDNNYINYSLELHENSGRAIDKLCRDIDGKLIVAHNAPFEQRTLAAMGIEVPSNRFIDSAVLARAAGAAGKLEAAAPQLLNVDKMAEGKDLIRLFSIPGKYQEMAGSLAFNPEVIRDHPTEWARFRDYCELDAELGLRIARYARTIVPSKENTFNAITMDMNVTGWHVDVPMVEEMQRRYLENQEVALATFRARHDAAELNLNSLPQLKEWCAERGIRAMSFDEKNVAKLIARIEKKLATSALEVSKQLQYEEVLDLLRTKQILGGSSLKKLQTILDTTSKDCRLRDQYLHVGAGQSYRTTGRGVQMQNLKRLGGEPADMLELQDIEAEWNNDKLAANIRQLFTATDPQGALIVGDFSSVESRGLAWQAGATEKLEAFRKGLDVYKVGAAKQYGVTYDAVTKDQRQFGKVGELSCGYQAGGEAVQSFAEGMGVRLTEGEASKLVSDWRSANPEIVQYWWDLDDALNTVLDGKLFSPTVPIGPDKDWKVQVYRTDTPQSLLDQHAKARSIRVDVIKPGGRTFLSRVFHGCYRRGRNICYYKPSELKSGDLWHSTYTDQKTKQAKFYSIYGGKLAGILTQSICREMFFAVLASVHDWVGRTPSLELVGQFHDEIVLDWSPACDTSLDWVKQMLESSMSTTELKGFPLVAEVKHDYRYTK